MTKQRVIAASMFNIIIGVLTSFLLKKGDHQVQNNLDKMEAGAGKVPCRGARVNIGDMDEMVRSF